MTVLSAAWLCPGRVLAERSVRGLWMRLFHGQTPASTEESALAPIVPALAGSQHALNSLHSRFPRQRLQAIEAIHQSGDASPRVMEALVKSTQDKNAEVSRRAAETLISLCRSGHEEGVVRAFARAINRPPRIVQKVVETGYAFKIPDRAEEERVQDILNNRR